MTYVLIPDDFADGPEWLDLSDRATLAFVRLLAYCGKHRTDGSIPRQVPAMLRCSREAVAELVRSGHLTTAPDGWHVADPDRFLWTEDKREKKRMAGRLGGLRTQEKARSGQASALPDAEANALAPTPAPREASAKAVPVPVPVPVGTDRSTYDGWSAEWRPFLDAWHSRGLRFPPTERQRETLWPIVDFQPTTAATWVREAPPDAKAADVVGYVIRRWKALEAEVIARNPEPDDGPA